VSGRRRGRPALLAVLLGLGLLWSCHSGSNTLQPSSRRAMLDDVARVVIIPTYDALVAEAELLAATAAQLAATPTEDTLVALQDAWRRTRAVWKQSEAFAIGPAEALRSASKIDWSPVRSERIEERIAGTDELTAAYVADLGTNLKGFLALEYLLFDPADGNAAVLQALDADVRRRGMVRALAENLRDETVILRDAWVPGAGDFATELGNAGNGSSVFPTVKSAVDTLVNRLIFLSEDVADAQLLAALGARTGGTPHPELLDAHRSENGLSDLLDNLAGVQNVYFGGYAGRQGGSLYTIVHDLNGDTANAISLSIRRALETATAIAEPLEQAVTSDRPAVERAQVRAKELMRRLEIDLVSVLGTTLRFNPSDGD
jgi:predicted lipoprotein